MTYLKIANKGLIDVRLLTLMGATVKRNDPTKIGQFGTGLKYALAHLLSQGIEVRVFIGKWEVKLETREEKVQDVKYQVLVVSDQKTCLTTSMSYGWETWEAIREIYCNALDEGEVKVELTDVVEGSPDTTCFYLQLTGTVKEVYYNWPKYFAAGREKLYTGDTFTLYAGSWQELIIYKKGIRVFSIPQPSVFHYDFISLPLNENRSPKYPWEINTHILLALASINDPSLVKFYLDNFKGKYEEKLSFDYSSLSLSYAWRQAIGDKVVVSSDMVGTAQVALNENMVEVQYGLFSKLTSQFPFINSLGIAIDNTLQYVECSSPHLQKKIDDCLTLLKRAGYTMITDKIVTGHISSSWQEKYFSAIDIVNKKIVIDECAKVLSQEEILSLILEENELLRSRLTQKSADFVRHLCKELGSWLAFWAKMVHS